MDMWATGIFTMMSVMVTAIGIILATRFVYLDNRYDKIIKKYEIDIQELNEKRDKQESDDKKSDIITQQFAINSTIGEYKIKRESNRGLGAYVDLACLLVIITIGVIATFGIFSDQSSFIWLVVILAVSFALPLMNFFMHIKFTNVVRSI